MNRPRAFMHIVITVAAATALSACVVRPNQSASDPYGNVSDTTQAGNMATNPYYYRGTTDNAVPMNNDASITANVIQAIQASSAGASNLQVMTSNGIVSLSGVADTQATAQNSIEAARRVPGILRVDYDIEVRRR